MFVNVKYGNECGVRLMEFSSTHSITVNNVIGKARLRYGKCGSLQLFNDHGRELNSQEIVENARVYTVKTIKWKALYICH